MNDTPTGATILDQPWQLELYHLNQMKYALRIEVRTGMRHSRGSVLRAANAVLLRNGRITRPCRTKVACLEALDLFISHREAEAIERGVMQDGR